METQFNTIEIKIDKRNMQYIYMYKNEKEDCTEYILWPKNFTKKDIISKIKTLVNNYEDQITKLQEEIKILKSKFQLIKLGWRKPLIEKYFKKANKINIK